MTTKQSWEDRFDEHVHVRGMSEAEARHLKAFISQLLAEERAKVVEEMKEKMQKDIDYIGANWVAHDREIGIEALENLLASLSPHHQ